MGFSLGSISSSEIDARMLPTLLNSKLSPFANGYINARHNLTPWTWVDGLDKTSWNSDQILRLYLSLPFTSATWDRVNDWIASSSNDYWAQVEFNPHQADGDLLRAVDALLTAGRPLRAIDCLHCRHYNNETLDIQRTVKSLWDAVNTKDSVARMNQHGIIQLISALKADQSTPEEELLKIEWAYLRLLDSNSRGRPETLFRKLCSDSQFFCEILRMVYKSDTEPENKDACSDESKKKIAENAWHLLHDWNRAPGVGEDGKLDAYAFKSWMESAIETCKRTGHYGIGLDQIGKALFYTPDEPDGSLWIAMVTAEFLNIAEYDEMRVGYSCEGFNSRGCHTPSVKASMNLHDDWLRKADAVEAEGFHRFATELRSLADSYKREAKRLKDDLR